MTQSEYAMDRARNRLEAMEKAEGDCQTAVEELLGKLAFAVGVSDKDRNHAVECVREALADMTSDARDAVEREISTLEDRIADAEWADLNRSSPVTL